MRQDEIDRKSAQDERQATETGSSESEEEGNTEPACYNISFQWVLWRGVGNFGVESSLRTDKGLVIKNIEVVEGNNTNADKSFTLPVEIVVSASRIPPWILKIPGSRLLKQINTTHWDLKVGPSFHDLKIRELYQTKLEVVFATSLAIDRFSLDERTSPMMKLRVLTRKRRRCSAACER